MYAKILQAGYKFGNTFFRGVFNARTASAVWIGAEVYDTLQVVESDSFSEEEKKALLMDQADFIGDTLVIGELIRHVPVGWLKSIPIITRLRKNFRPFNMSKRKSDIAYIIDPKKGFTFVDQKQSVVQAHLGTDGKLLVAPTLLQKIKNAKKDIAFLGGSIALDQTILESEEAVLAIANYFSMMIDAVKVIIEDDEDASKKDDSDDSIIGVASLSLDTLLDDPNYAMRRIANSLGTSDYRSSGVVDTYKTMLIKKLGIIEAVRTELVLSGSIKPLNAVMAEGLKQVEEAIAGDSDDAKAETSSVSGTSNGDNGDDDSRLSNNVRQFGTAGTG